MNNKRRARELDFTPVRPWPVVQRQRIEKLRSQRQEELEKACVVNFDWLENYYQGCVYAAKQNKRLILNRQLESTDPNLLSHHPPDIATITTPPPTSHNHLSFSENMDHSMTSQYDYQTDFHSQRALTIASPSELPRKGALSDSSKNNLVHYQLKSPKIPKSFSPMRSPKSPFDRHRIVSRRTRVRVDARAATRKSLRAERRRNGSGMGDKRCSDVSMQLLSTQDDKHLQSNQKTSTGHEMQPLPRHSAQLSYRSNNSNETLVNSGTFDSNYSDTEDSFQNKTPSRSMISTPIQLRLEDDDTVDLNEVLRSSTTPGSKARDSMTLISPANRSGSSKDRNSNDYSSPLVNKVHGQKRPGDPLSKHHVQETDFDMNSIMQGADYNRNQSSTFQDSIAPVRFGSPKPESSQLEFSALKTREMEKKSRSQSTDLSSSMDILSKDMKSIIPETSQQYTRKETLVIHPDSRHLTKSAGTPMVTDNLFSNLGVNRSQSLKGDIPSTLKNIDTYRDRMDVSMLRRELSRESLSQHTPVLDEGNNALAKSSNNPKTPGTERESSASNSNQDERGPNSIATNEKTSSSQGPTILKDLLTGTVESRPSIVTSSDKSSNSSSDGFVPRSRVATTLPEKRTLGHRKPFTLSSNTSTQMPPSRLLKLASAPASLTLPTSSTGAAASQSQQSSTRNPKTATAILSKDTQQPTQSTTTKSTTSSSSALNILRQGVPRAPLPSMKATESSMARSEGQSTLNRRPFLVSKTNLNFRKPTRPVLPDSTLTAKSVALSGVSPATKSATPTSPSKKDFKREQTPVDRNREQTPDIASKVSGMVNQHSLGSTPSSLAITPMQQLKNSLSSIGSARKPTFGGDEVNPPVPHRNGETDSSNPFLVPTAARSLSSSWSRNQSLNRGRQEQTVLPEIWSDEEDENGQIKKPAYVYPVPKWAEWDELNKSMQKQCHRNPEEIFGPLPLLDMDEIFPGSENANKRTSSAWGVADHITPQEISRYNKDMGWKKKD